MPYLATTGEVSPTQSERVVLGDAKVRGVILQKQPTPDTLTVTATLTTAQIISGLLLANQGAGAAATYTMPTGSVFEAALKALPFAMDNDDAFDFSMVNVSTVGAEDVTIAGATGMVAVGNMTIASNAAVTDQAWGTFRLRKVDTNSYTFYRIG